MPKYTVLAEIHKELDARFSPFHGWHLPVNYPGGVLAEHKHVSRFCGIFDSCHTGKIRVAGENCVQALDEVLMYKVSSQDTGSSRQNYLLSDSGSFLAEVSVFRMAEEDFFITSNAGQTAAVLKQFTEKFSSDTVVQDLTEVIAKIDLLGPEAPNVLKEAEADESLLPVSGGCGIVEIAGIRCIVNAPQNAGVSGYELFCSADNAIDLWDELTCIEPVRPCGSGAKEILRIEQGILAPGTEYNSTTTPLDCGLEIPEYSFTGKAALLNMKRSCRFVFVKLESKQSVHAGDKVCLSSGEEAGTVTSSCVSSVTECACAICRLASDKEISAGVNVLIHSGSSCLPGTVCTPANR
ncbi:MAG: hypothetical protein IKC05_02305 [Lentisphaeria bacterium]|nr:hypothetical protein [Lentisphaeria bacterium]